MEAQHPKQGLISVIKDPVTPLGLLFLLVNLFTSYMFYQVNSFKIVMVLGGVTLLFLVALWPGKWAIKEQPPLKVWLILSLPLLMTFPGFLIQGGNSNYNFDYELVSNLVLILWAGFLYQTINSESSLDIFLGFIGSCIIIVSIWALTSKLGINPLDDTNSIKASFGNRNYFAG
ncbi:MAG: hypothetical protein GY786_15625, partial [Proteobacteria bacterium]|nr:hypothetical protein [Pseudomonadota bacterium]